MKKERKLKGLDRRYDIQDAKTIDFDVLEVIPYEYEGKVSVIDIDTSEFTSVCPYSGLPDFGKLQIHYIPRKYLIELRSLKYYLYSYRSVGMYQEHITQRILHDLISVLHPKWMLVELDYNVRGGIHTVVKAEWGRRKQ